ncbi:MAG: transketolase [Planctomycetes bacterium GWC2_45_44]|nr:MAG: transketolase [Planctomycetes bacterium GWC2_45_44]HBR19008.1 transketolase [Phycisphaerales bacterium]
MTTRMREVYSDTLIRLAEKDRNIVVLEADLMAAHATKSFMEKFPERTFNVGVAEANMVGIACGLSARGKIPFAGSFAPFVTRRAYDQFFVSANYAKLNVKLMGSDPGITAAYNGGTHMPFEDVGIMRNVPGLIIYEPADGVSLQKLLTESAYRKGNVYLRLHRGNAPGIYNQNDEIKLGKANVLKDGNDVTLIASGVVMVNEALKASEMLQKEGVSAAVIDMHTIKPLDEEIVLKYAAKTSRIVTCENHQVMNGLGSAVAEVLSEKQPILMKRIGVNDEFGEVGDIEYLKERFGLTAKRICESARSLLVTA